MSESEIKEILNEINILRQHLENLIESEDSDLISEEIVHASVDLDVALNEYNQLINATIKKNKY